MRISYAIVFTILFASHTLAYGGAKPKAGFVDSRIKTVVYDARNVTEVHSHYGYETQIVFAPDETVTHVAVGDSLAWQIFPVANNIFLKPQADNADTNMSVLTNKRSYSFDLLAKKNYRKSRLTYKIVFHYPEDDLRVAMAKTKRIAQIASSTVIPGRAFDPAGLNFNYTRRGSDLLAPIRVFDDGEFTYFQFDEKIAVPAIFIVNPDKTESLVNFHKDPQGHYYVVQRLAGQFALRDDKIVTCIYNESWRHKSASEVPVAQKAAASDDFAGLQGD